MGAHDLDRFRKAQDRVDSGFEAAFAEVSAGSKRGHWIWYIFPQLSGLGSSPLSETYAISSLAEARDYLRDPVLNSRLLTITATVAERSKQGVSLSMLMGSRIDVLKLVSSLTLFGHVARTLYEGERDESHLALAQAADEVLAAAASQGYPRCRYTLGRLRG